MRILVLSSTPWDDKNSFGITFSNFFKDIDGLEFANIYCSAGNPSNNLHMNCFQITPTRLVKNRLCKSISSGILVENNTEEGVVLSGSEEKSLHLAKIYRLQVLFGIRECIWKLGLWNSKEFNAFIEDFDPDIIFQPIYPHRYMNRMAQYIKAKTKVPMVSYMSDDDYSFRQLRFSPLYWLDRFWKRPMVEKTINLCDILYVISDIQKEECEKVFTPPCKILTKCADFPEREFSSQINQGEIKLLYGGNIGSGRWKSLALIADAVAKLKAEGFPVRFDIYSGTPYTRAMKKALTKAGSYLHEPIAYAQLLERQQNADILVHAEGLSLKSRLEVHQSFSTKLVDYFEMGKCIFAVGTEDVASINHLMKHNAAVVAQNKAEIYGNLKHLLNNPQEILLCGENAYACGAKCHNKKVMQKELMEDLSALLGKNG